MNASPLAQRPYWLQRDFTRLILPATLLLAATGAFALWLVLDALGPEPQAQRTAEPVADLPPPAA